MRSKALLLSVGIVSLALTLGGCAPDAPPSPTRPSVESSAGASGDGTVKAMVPTLEFVDPKTLPPGVKASVGATLPAGSYRPVVSGSQIRAIRLEGAASPSAVSFSFDSTGTKAFADWTTAHFPTRDALLVVMRGKVVAAPVAEAPILDGSVSFRIKSVDEFREEVRRDLLPRW